ncbi:META domain-containing protein [Methanospirillum sp.]|uniref:META domain-containing protein n=1 Tax=Methanospirillum sp. TaxID=45200 RepID=UPI0035A16C38
MKIIFSGIIIIMLAVIAGCVAQEERVSPLDEVINVTPVSAFYGDWALIEITDMNNTPLITPGDAKVTINFTKTNELSGNSGCNRYFGVYNLTGEYFTHGSGITISSIGSTMMFCQDTMDIETVFLQSLHSVNSYTMDDQILSLWDEAGNHILFNRNFDKEADSS